MKTQHYLRFPMEMIKSDFPSLSVIIEDMENVQKKSIRANILRANIYKNITNFTTPH